MENLNIEATKYTPKIDLNAEEKVLIIVGKSYPENTFEFYEPVVSWIKKFFDHIEDEDVLINIDLEYLNSSSLKAYFDIFDIFEKAQDNGKNLKIKWIYDEENDIAEETGEDFIEDFDMLDIELVTKEL